MESERRVDFRVIVSGIAMAVVATFLWMGTPSAFAGTSEEIAALPVLDPLNRDEESLLNGGTWAPLVWAPSASGHPTGRDTTAGWGPFDAFPVINGAYWKTASFKDQSGSAVAVTLAQPHATPEQSFALWLGMESPGTKKSGYQLRWVLNPSGTNYTVTLSRFVSGSPTVLASNAAFSIPKGSTLAISDLGTVVTAWSGIGPGFVPIFSANDATYSSGYAGIEGSGALGRLTNFKAGALSGNPGLPPVLDAFDRQEVPLFSAKWSKPPWVSSIGGSWCCTSRRGYGSQAGLAGAFWNSTQFTDTAGASTVVAATIGAGPPEGQYVSLMLNLIGPGSTHAGYDARITGAGPSTYKVELGEWLFNSRVPLAVASGVPLPVGTTLVFARTPAGAMTVSTGSPTSTPIVSATDTSWPFGYAGVEVNGVAGTVYDFRAGRVDLEAPDTTINSGPTGKVLPENANFTFSSPESGSSFECSLDGAAYSSCTSPKSYPTIGQGSHTFKVRALDAAKNADPTPAERSFQVAWRPTASTSAATGITSTGATLNGTANPNGWATTYQFEWGTTTAYGSVVPATPKELGAGSTALSVSEPLAGLAPGTTYHFRLSAVNANGTSKSEDRVFTTQAAPTAKTDAAVVSSTQATLKATVNPRGAATTAQFEYGPTEAYGTKVPATAKALGSGYADVAMAETVASGLTPGITYHYRVVANNSLGTTVGEDMRFALPKAPTATTEAAAAVHGSSAQLNGAVDPNGSSTTYWFEYGPTTAYGTKAPVPATDSGSSGDPIEAYEIVEDLAPLTTYHYRIVAASSLGTSNGADMTFTTKAAGSSEDEYSGTIANEQIPGSDDQGPEGTTSGAATRSWKVGEAEPLPRSFINVHWSKKVNTDKEMLHVHKIGSSYLRLSVRYDLKPEGAPETEEFFEKAVQHGAAHGVRILPYLYGPNAYPVGAEQDKYVGWVKGIVEKYGPNGSYWNGKANKQPIRVWEIWNEPNRGFNHPGGQVVNPTKFSTFLVRVSNAIESGSNGAAESILGGLLSVKTANDIPSEGIPGATEEAMNPGEFLRKLTPEARASYVAVGLHPYAFKAPNGAFPTNSQTAEGVAKSVLNNVEGVRQTMNSIGDKDKPMWLTELGWPLEYGDAAHPSPNCSSFDANGKCVPACTTKACETVHAEILSYTFQKLRANYANLGIANVFYYFLRDFENQEKWQYHTGLRKLGGKWREAVYAFEAAAGVDEWPRKPPTATGSAVPRSTFADVPSTVDPEASETEYRIAYGEASVGEKSTGWKNVGYGEDPVSQTTRIEGLKPKTPYSYQVIAKNENEEVGEGVIRSMKTEPLTDTTGTLGEVLNGEPGWAGVSGWLKHDGVGMTGVKVNVNFRKENPSTHGFEHMYTEQASVVNGQYSVSNVRLGVGTWKWKVVFNAVENGYPASWESNSDEPNEHPEFFVKNGYQLVAKHSSKCLDVNQGSTQNNASLIQYDCGSPQTALNQVVTLQPVGPSEYMIRVRKSNRCVGVTAGSQTPGQQLSQYDCLGQAHQIWRGEPVQYLPDGNVVTRFVAKHSNQCMEVQASSQANGGIVDQYPCNGTQANQLWTFKSVQAGQVPVDASITVDETLHGHPGYVTFHGNVTSNAYDMTGYWVNVNFQREVGPGQWQTESTKTLPLSPQGSFSYFFWGLGSGRWQTRVVLQGSGPLESGASEYRPITVLDGYRIKFRHSDRCLSTTENKTANGTPFIQWDCNTSQNPYEGQTFSFRPVGVPGARRFQILPDTTAGSANPYEGRCVDVGGNTTTMGAAIVLYDCLGPEQWNQIWEVLPIAGQEPWFGAVAVHSQQCMDVQGQNPNNGARVQQWECYWGGNQQWRFIPVG